MLAVGQKCKYFSRALFARKSFALTTFAVAARPLIVALRLAVSCSMLVGLPNILKAEAQASCYCYYCSDCCCCCCCCAVYFKRLNLELLMLINFFLVHFLCFSVDANIVIVFVVVDFLYFYIRVCCFCCS